MSNLKQDTGKPRFLKLLFVVLMMSVGLNLLLGCGKNKGQVVGPQPTCQKPDCDEDKKPFSGDLWETALGIVNYPGYIGWGYHEPAMYITLGLDLYLSSSAGSQAIVPNPTSGNVQAEGSLWVDQMQLLCGYNGWGQPSFESVPAGEYKVVKNLRDGVVTSNGFRGNQIELKKGDSVLRIEFGDLSFIPGQNIKDPANNSYDSYLFGQIAITNNKGCYAYPYVSTGGQNNGYFFYIGF